MSTAVLAAAACAIAAGALAAVARILLRPLAAILVELCGESHRAEFWTQMVTTCTVAGTVSATLMGLLDAPAHPALAAAALLRWTLLGLGGSLLVTVAVVAAFSRRADPPPRDGAGRPWSSR